MASHRLGLVLIASATVIGSVSLVGASSTNDQSLAPFLSVSDVEDRASPVTLSLLPVDPGVSLSARLQTLQRERHFFLIFRGRSVEIAPLVKYQIYLDWSGKGDKHDHLIGEVAFSQTAAPVRAESIFASFDITQVVQSLKQLGSLGDRTSILFEPVGKAADGTKVRISFIEIMEQPVK
jgi:hypothetical protein